MLSLTDHIVKNINKQQQQKNEQAKRAHTFPALLSRDDIADHIATKTVEGKGYPKTHLYFHVIREVG